MGVIRQNASPCKCQTSAFSPDLSPSPLPLSVYYPDVPTRTALELPAPKDKSVDKGAAVPPAEAVSANPAQPVAIPPAMKNRPLPDIPTESVSQLKLKPT